MSDQGNTPVTLVSVPDELEAAMIVSALAAHGIDASTTGSFTAGFRAEAPGEVQILVRASELEKAQTALKAVQSDQPENAE